MPRVIHETPLIQSSPELPHVLDPVLTEAAGQSRVSLAGHLAVFCAAVGGFMNLYCTQAIYPELRLRFGLSVADAGALLTATTLGLALAAPFAGRAGNRFGPRAAILWGIAGLALSSFVFGFAGSRPWLISLRLLQGLLIPVVLSALLASISVVWSGAQALSVSATYVTGTVMGGLVGRFLPAYVLPGFGWQAAFTCFALVQALLLLSVWRLYPHTEAQVRFHLPVREWVNGLWPALRNRLAGVSAAGFCLLFTQTAVTTYIAIRLASPPFYWSTKALGALYAVFIPALVFVRLTPRLMSRIGPSRTLITALGLGWAGLGLTLFSPTVAVVFGLTLFSVSVFIAQTVLAHMVGADSEQNKEMSAGIYLSFYYFGGSAGAVVPALFWSAGGWKSCLGLVASVQALGFLVVYATRRREPMLAQTQP